MTVLKQLLNRRVSLETANYVWKAIRLVGSGDEFTLEELWNYYEGNMKRIAEFLLDIYENVNRFDYKNQRKPNKDKAHKDLRQLTIDFVDRLLKSSEDVKTQNLAPLNKWKTLGLAYKIGTIRKELKEHSVVGIFIEYNQKKYEDEDDESETDEQIVVPLILKKHVIRDGLFGDSQELLRTMIEMKRARVFVEKFLADLGMMMGDDIFFTGKIKDRITEWEQQLSNISDEKDVVYGANRVSRLENIHIFRLTEKRLLNHISANDDPGDETILVTGQSHHYKVSWQRWYVRSIIKVLNQPILPVAISLQAIRNRIQDTRETNQTMNEFFENLKQRREKYAQQHADDIKEQNAE